jgi:O-acetylhomoserine (thiol)-lyase
MEPGDTVVAATRLYGGSVQQLTNMIRKFGWSCEFVDVDDLAAVKTALQKPKVKALFIESLANPGAVVADISALADAAHTAGVPLMVDNTLATPYLCNPLAHGADIVIHSTTKFLSGHGSCMGGVVIDSGKFDWTKYPEKFPSLASPNPAYHGLNFAAALGPMAFTFYGIAIGLRDLGLCLSPFNAWCTLTNIATLPLRMEKHCANAKVCFHAAPCLLCTRL